MASMWSLGFLLTTVFHSFYLTQVYAVHHDIRNLQARNIIEATSIASSYDFVIAGGGVAGMVIANRLSEDANTSVLVLEAGGTGDDVSASIDIPADTYYATLLGSDFNWGYHTIPQPKAGNIPLSWPRGKGLGGSSAINGLYLVRPSQLEVDLWSSLIASQDNTSALAWNWDNMFAAMKQTETFTPPSSQIQKTGDIQYNQDSHGTSGPLHYSYPGYMVPAVGDWSPTLEAVGIPATSDASGGQTYGNFVATSAINPSNWTRSYARAAYLDSLPNRPNLAVLPMNTVTRIIFSGNSSDGSLIASQVEYASSQGAAKKTVNVNKEVILTGGAIGSPQILMLSGVGPPDVLQAAGVPVNLPLPGVGQHLQDHLSSQVIWAASGDTYSSLYHDKYSSTPTTSNPFLSFVNSATAYVNITTLLGSAQAATFQTQIIDALASSSSSLVPSNDSTVIAGYQAIYNATVNQILMSPIGQVELLLDLTGTQQAGSQSVAVQCALQHPYSQGQITITSNNPFQHPTIDPRYLTHSADITMLREGLKLARKIGQTAPLSNAMGKELFPGPAVNTDAEWDAYISKNVGTEYHPSCTCAMLPKSQGGVVDANLRVYGLANVRVADSSVYPIEFAAHLQAPTYGLAEQAAAIIRSNYNGVPVPWAPSSTSQPSATTASSSNSSAAGSHFQINGGLITALGTFFAIMTISVFWTMF
jgi:choline dehydrogenase